MRVAAAKLRAFRPSTARFVRRELKKPTTRSNKPSCAGLNTIKKRRMRRLADSQVRRPICDLFVRNLFCRGRRAWICVSLILCWCRGRYTQRQSCGARASSAPLWRCLRPRRANPGISMRRSRKSPCRPTARRRQQQPRSSSRWRKPRTPIPSRSIPSRYGRGLPIRPLIQCSARRRRRLSSCR